MKTFARLIRRYVFAAVGLGLLLPALCIGLLVWLGWRPASICPNGRIPPARLRIPWCPRPTA